MIKLLIILLFLFCSYYSESQNVILLPEVGEQTHPDLNILSITRFKDSTVFYLSVENKLVQGGWFCADKKIYIEIANNYKRYNLLKTRGIPTCPLLHNFKSVGEKLNFTLVFPGIPAETNLLNLIEDCDNACFRFSGIILSEQINNDIKLYNNGIQLYANGKIQEALDCFSKVVTLIPDSPTHVYGFSYFNLIKIYSEKGDKETSKFWLDKLDNSKLPDKQYFIELITKAGLLLK